MIKSKISSIMINILIGREKTRGGAVYTEKNKLKLYYWIILYYVYVGFVNLEISLTLIYKPVNNITFRQKVRLSFLKPRFLKIDLPKIFKVLLNGLPDLRVQILTIWKMRNLSIWLVDPFLIWPIKSAYSSINGFDSVLISCVVCIIQIFRICTLRAGNPYSLLKG